jgi:hypothetical protein
LSRLAAVVFLALVAATFGAFFAAQRLKGATPVVELRGAKRAFSPNGDGRKDVLTTSFVLAQPATVNVSVEQAGHVVTDVVDGRFGAGPQKVTWDGTVGTGRARDGTYAVVVNVTTEAGTVAHPALFRVDTRPPVLRAISFRRLTFRVSEPARVTVVADRRRIVRSVRAGTVSFGRTARRVRAWAEDPAGNLSRTIRSG